MNTPQAPRPDPELILRGVQALRWRMEELAGTELGALELLRIDSLVHSVATASTPEAQQLAVVELLRFAANSPFAALFEAIVAHAASSEAMDALVRRKKGLEDQRQRPRRLRQEDEPSQPPRRPRPPLQIPPTSSQSESLTSPAASGPPQDPLDEIRTWSPPPKPSKPPESVEPNDATGDALKESDDDVADASTEAGAHVNADEGADMFLGMQEPPPEPRCVNLFFVEKDELCVPTDRPLIVGQRYLLRVGIGVLSKHSIVRTPGEVRADLLPAADSGHWLKVIAVSNALDVASVGHWLFLPKTGAAWICACPRDQEHTCSRAGRAPYLSIPIGTRQADARAELRVTVYHEGAVVQSLLVTATVTESALGTGTNTAVVDYNLTDRLTDLEQIGPRALSVVMNDAADGSHVLVFNGAHDEAVALRLTDGQMLDAVMMMRQVVRGFHIEDRKGKGWVNRYDANNRKPLKEFITDLRELAAHGWNLWITIWGNRLPFWMKHRNEFLGGSDVIQIARKQNSTSVFPWAFVYAIPIDTGAPENNRVCKLLEEQEWLKFQDAKPPDRCPFESEHSQYIICPYGFWGFRYEIEQPVSLREGQQRAQRIPAEPLPLDVVLALSGELDSGLLNAHLATLETQSKDFKFLPCRTRSEIQKGLAGMDVELVYFYCHGRAVPLSGTDGSTPSLGVGNKEVIYPADLVNWVLGWPEGHWQTTRPLVFLNGCHTADTVPQTLVNFVDTFCNSLNASGVIGTEITLNQLVANEMGQTFLGEFQRGMTVGQSLRLARGNLLRKGNLLGLVYTAYCSADLRFSKAVV